VCVDHCLAERHAVIAAEANVNKIHADLQELHDETERAPESEQDAISRGIRRHETQFLTPAIAALQTARAAREACRTQSTASRPFAWTSEVPKVVFRARSSQPQRSTWTEVADGPDASIERATGKGGPAEL
jgi:hypothetical protein